MYYYYNTETEESTWHYPDVIAPLPSDETPQGVEKPPLPPEPEPEPEPEPSSPSAIVGPLPKPAQPPLPSGEPPEPQATAAAPLPPQESNDLSKERGAKVTSSVTPAIAPTHDSIISRPAKLSSVDQGEAKKVIMDPYRARLLKKKQAQTSTVPKIADTDEKISQLFLGVSQPPPPPGEEEMPPAPWDDPVPAGARSPYGNRTPEAIRSGRDSPSLSSSKTTGATGAPLPEDNMATVTRPTTGVTQVAEALNIDVPNVEVVQLSTKKPKGKKEKKRKVATATGIPSKKRKHVSSLVQKWQQVKQQVEEEMAEESSEEEDIEVVNQRKIEEWKAQQQSTGKAAHNPNFEEIKGDWRERVKKAREKRGLPGPS